MTVLTLTDRNIYDGTGSTTVFPYTFQILQDSDMVVSLIDADGIETTLTISTDYTVSGAGSESGGNVTLLVAPDVGVTVLLLRLVPYTQPTDYKNQGSFYPRTHERSFDRAGMQIQQLKARQDRSFELPAYVEGVSTELPVPVASNLVGWDDTAQRLRNYSLAEIATNVAYADLHFDTFTASAAQVNFTLTADPGSLGNLDVSVDGVTQVNGVDFTYLGTTLTFTTPMAGGEKVLARYGEALPTGITNASAVNYMPDGTGAVQRTVQNRLLDTVCVFDFMSPTQIADVRAGTALIDVTAAVQSALTYIGTLGGGALRVPSGRYRISATLIVYDKTAIIGDGWFVNFAGSVGAPAGTVFVLAAGSNCDMFRQFDATKRYSLHFQDFCLDGDGANQSNNMGPDGGTSIYQFNRNGFYFTALYNTRWVNVRCQNMRGSGWVINGDGSTLCTNFFLEYCSAYNCRVYCVNFRGSATDGHINFGDYGFGRCGGISLDSPSHTVRSPIVWTSQCQDITDANTHSSGTGAVSDATGGIRVNGANCRIIGPTSEGHAGHGIKVTVNGDSCEIRDPTIYFVSATAGSSGNFDGINADAVDDLKIFDPVVKNSGSATTTIRYAIELDSAHTRARVMGGDLRRLGASAAEVTTPVVIGLKSGDRSDFAWAISDVDVYQNTLQAVGAAFQTIPFQVENADVVGEFATPTFTAAEYGFYRVETAVAFSPADGSQGSVSIFKNGSELKRLSSYRAGSAGTVIVGGSLVVELAATETLDIRGFCSVSTNTVIGQTVTWLRIRQVTR